LDVGVCRVGLGRLHVGLGLRDFFRPTAVMESIDHGSLRVYGGLDLGDLRLNPPGIDAGQQLPLLHAVPLLDENLGDPLVVVERQLHLAEVEISEELELGGGAFALIEPPGCAGRGADDQDQQDEQPHPSHRLPLGPERRLPE
jgi:hypothetical protein